MVNGRILQWVGRDRFEAYVKRPVVFVGSGDSPLLRAIEPNAL